MARMHAGGLWGTHQGSVRRGGVRRLGAPRRGAARTRVRGGLRWRLFTDSDHHSAGRQAAPTSIGGIAWIQNPPGDQALRATGAQAPRKVRRGSESPTENRNGAALHRARRDPAPSLPTRGVRARGARELASAPSSPVETRRGASGAKEGRSVPSSLARRGLRCAGRVPRDPRVSVLPGRAVPTRDRATAAAKTDPSSPGLKEIVRSGKSPEATTAPRARNSRGAMTGVLLAHPAPPQVNAVLGKTGTTRESAKAAARVNRSSPGPTGIAHSSPSPTGTDRSGESARATTGRRGRISGDATTGVPLARPAPPQVNAVLGKTGTTRASAKAAARAGPSNPGPRGTARSGKSPGATAALRARNSAAPATGVPAAHPARPLVNGLRGRTAATRDVETAESKIGPSSPGPRGTARTGLRRRPAIAPRGVGPAPSTRNRRRKNENRVNASARFGAPRGPLRRPER
jgi:hypothetical protein